MPTPPLTEQDLRAIWSAVDAHGSIADAGAALGIPRKTAGDRYRRAMRELGLEDVRTGAKALAALAGATARRVEAAPFTVAPLPSADEPIEELLNRREAAAKRRLEAAAAREALRFEIHEAAPFALVFVGDPHADDDGCDLGKLRRDLALIEATPGMHGVGMGDWTNAWAGRLSRLYAQQGTTDAEAWRFAEWMLGKPIWLLLLMGNHDLWHGAGSPLRWMAREGRAPLLDWEAKFTVACGGAEWKIHAAHDFPGHSMWNRLHAPLKRAKMTGHGADLYIAAHRHTFALAQEQDEHSGRVSWLARCRGYKALDSYATALGYGRAQSTGESIAAVCDPSTGAMTCFADINLAASYLTWLRRPRVRVAAGKP